MSRIFTFDQIERGHVPDIHSFPLITDMLRGRLPHVQGFLAGVLCGSASKGRCDIRSDVDGIGIFDPAYRNSVHSAMQLIHEEAAARRVPLDFRMIRSDVIDIGGHGISASFAWHLNDVAQFDKGLIGTSPLPGAIHPASIAPNPEDMRREARDYIARKLQQFGYLSDRLSTLSEADLYRFLEKMISVPVHAARKMLWLHGFLVPNDAADTVIIGYRGEADRRELRIFDRLILADEEYTRALPSHLKNRDATEYAIQIGTIYDLIPDCMELLAIMLRKLAKL